MFIYDYYPFGMLVPNRNYQSPEYRYGFQGQEKDDEIKGNGNSLNYKYRMHDPRVGRFFAVDPLTKEYPYYTPYQFSGNKVIHAVELEGLEEFEVNGGKVNGPYANSDEAQAAVDSGTPLDTWDLGDLEEVTLTANINSNNKTSLKPRGLEMKGISYSRGYDAKWGKSNGYLAKIEQGYSLGNFSIDNTIAFGEYEIKGGYQDFGIDTKGSFKLATTNLTIGFKDMPQANGGTANQTLSIDATIGEISGEIKYGVLKNNGYGFQIGGGAYAVKVKAKYIHETKLFGVKVKSTYVLGGSALSPNAGIGGSWYFDNKGGLHLNAIGHLGLFLGGRAGFNYVIGGR